MRPSGDPSRAFAVIVGVEQCGVFADDPLRGPVRDAIAWFDWFRARGVPSGRIAMFLSPKSDSQSLVDDWRKRRGESTEQEPRETEWQQFISVTLPKFGTVQDGTLFVVWAGHGLIDLRGHERTRRLFYSDSNPRLARNLELVALMKALRTRELAGFAQQIMIVDACANYAIGLTREDALIQPTVFPPRAPAVGIQQRVMLATAPGQLAQIDTGGSGRESVARFSRRLRNALGEPQAAEPAWPDFHAAFNVVKSSFERENASQTPVDWCFATPDDALPDSGVVPLADVVGSRLLAALQSVTDDELLQAAFYAAIQPAHPTDAHHTAARGGLMAMVTLLQQATLQAGALSPLVRWALQVKGRLVTRRNANIRAGTPADDPPAALSIWLDAIVDKASQERYRLQQPLEDDADARRIPCHLLVLEEATGSPGGPSELQGWIFGGTPLKALSLTDDRTPLTVQPDGGNRAFALKTLLDWALQAAKGELHIPNPEIIVEWALPTGEVDSDIESTLVGLPGRERKLGTKHLVVRRLLERLEAMRAGYSIGEIDAWRQAARDLRQRLSAHGLRIVWLEPQVIRDTGLAVQLGAEPCAGCIGLVRTPATPTLDAALKWTLFDDALPFACWRDQEWAEGEQACLDQDLRDGATLPPLLLAQQLRARWQGGRPHPGARLRLLWDDPLHDPYETRLGAR